MVIVGGNGAGKSSVLEAVDICLSWVAKRLASGTSGGRYPEEADINDSSKWSLVRIQASIGGKSVRWAVGKSRKGYPIDYPSDVQALSEIARAWREENVKFDALGSMPLIYYYKVSRSITDVPTKLHEPKDTSPFSAYTSGRPGYNLNFRDFLYWFKQQRGVEYQQGKESRKLNLVREAIATVVPDFCSPEIDMRTNEFFLYSEVRKKRIAMGELSDGQRTLITLVADIAKRAAVALGEKEDIGRWDVQGVVLIDEIELHLHPKWQSGIINDLQLAFPRLQIIATTHSPAVLTNVKDTNSFALIDGQLFSPKSFGRTSDALLEDVFDAPSSDESVERQFQTLNLLIDDHKFSAARELLEQLRDILPDDHRVAAADVMLWMPAE